MGKFYGKTTGDVTALERENQRLVRELAGECMVLLENDGTLPLQGISGRKLALYGNGARHTIKGGTGSGDVNTRETIHIEQGLEEAGAEIVTKDWLDAYDRKIADAKESYMKWIREKAKEENTAETWVMLEYQYQDPDIPEIEEKAWDADAAIYVLSRNSGEGKDRSTEPGDYFLTEGEEQAIRTLAEKYEKFILLLNVGGIIDMKVIKSIEGINSILIIGQTGNMGGRIVADVLAGKTIPSGRLSDTWAERYEDYPSASEFSHNNGNVDDEYYKEGIYVGYRYFDTFDVTPLYCFGYGKSYTHFTCHTKKVNADANEVRIEVEVENKGEFAGKDVVQVYISAPQGTLEKPYQELKAFAKTRMLQPGEAETIELAFSTASMASYSVEKHAWILESGDYLVRVGESSRDTTVAAVLHLDAAVITVQTGDVLCENEEFEELTQRDAFDSRKQKSFENTEIPEFDDAEKMNLYALDFVTEQIRYPEVHPILEDKRAEKLTLQAVKDGKASLSELVSQLSIEEMALLCVGTERLNGEVGNVVGSASTSVPGAAGETEGSLMESRGIFPLVLADGPAGLRLQPHFKTTADGKLLRGGEIFGLNAQPFQDDIPDDAVDYYQYCTAIPIANTLAQSWDMDLIQKMGSLVGAEMQEFHVHLWLAPGMNIHRNPLCGRNFEYYSEDPVLSGACAAACTKGVQMHGGHGTTIKHFAANNQEDNRLFSNSHVKERALREIYLKGFEIAIRESKPYAMMTSYNLLNGTHTANHAGLLSVARNEWGFDGLIMTDWYTSQDTSFLGPVSDVYPHSSSLLCIQSGNDMQMPGCAENVQDIIDGVKEGTQITVGDLQFCVKNILGIALKCMDADDNRQ